MKTNRAAADDDPMNGRTAVRRGTARRRAIASAAENAFLDQGYAGTTMRDVARRAGASKETLYRHFGTKQALFGEVVGAMAVGLAAGVGEPSIGDERAKIDAAAILSRAALGFLRGLLAPRTVALYRVVLAESARAPELGMLFYEHGPRAVQRRLAALLTTLAGRGALRCADPANASVLLLGMVGGDWQLRCLVGAAEGPPDEARMVAYVREAVAAFLARYGN